MKRSLLALGSIALLAACGSGGGGPNYDDAQSVAQAAQCVSYKAQSPELFAADAGTCTYDGRPQGVQWFKDGDSLSSWLDAPDFGTVSLHGDNWAIECDSEPDCTAMQKKIGGSLN